MRATSSILLVLVSLAEPALATAGDTAKGDLARMQGTWTACAGPKKKIPVTLAIQGRDVSVVIKPPAGPEIRASGQIRVDVSATPKALDWVRFTALDGQAMPEILAIYEFDGDSLRICNAGPNNPRPTAFEPGEGVLADVVTFRRLPPPSPPGGSEGM